MSRSYIFRTLRSDFIDLCDGDRIAALLLDYFWQQGQKAIERQMNGSLEQVYIPLGWNYAIGVLLMPVGKNAVKRGIALLVERGYLTPHRSNGKSSGNQVNRYRPNMATIQMELNRWSQSEPYVYGWVHTDPRWVHTDPPSVQPDPPPGSAQTHPLGLHRPQDVVIDTVIESASSSPAVPAAMTMTIAEIDELIGGLLGRRPTKAQQQQIVRMLADHPPEQIRAAVDAAAARDARSLTYVAAILRNNAGRPASPNGHAVKPERRYFVAEPEEQTPLTPEEIAHFKQAVAAIRNGGAS